MHVEFHVVTNFKSHPGFLVKWFDCGSHSFTDSWCILSQLINMHLSSTCCVINVILREFMLIKFSVKQLEGCILFLFCPIPTPSSHKCIPKSNRCSFCINLLFWIIYILLELITSWTIMIFSKVFKAVLHKCIPFCTLMHLLLKKFVMSFCSFYFFINVITSNRNQPELTQGKIKTYWK